jgi:hypothetical protein
MEGFWRVMMILWYIFGGLSRMLSSRFLRSAYYCYGTWRIITLFWVVHGVSVHVVHSYLLYVVVLRGEVHVVVQVGLPAQLLRGEGLVPVEVVVCRVVVVCAVAAGGDGAGG